jgi:putative toxin-antitoxin system antitoxin component (TIGR02293 family)
MTTKAPEGRPEAATASLREYQEVIRTGRPGTYYYIKLLGISEQDPLSLAKRIERGLSFATLERFMRNTMLATDELAEVVDIKVRTLHRRREQGRLEPDESDRLLRFSRVFGKALELFEGDVEATRRWLSAPARALGGERPIALVKTDVGAREVENLIGRLEHGVVG